MKRKHLFWTGVGLLLAAGVLVLGTDAAKEIFLTVLEAARGGE